MSQAFGLGCPGVGAPAAEIHPAHAGSVRTNRAPENPDSGRSTTRPPAGCCRRRRRRDADRRPRRLCARTMRADRIDRRGRRCCLVHGLGLVVPVPASRETQWIRGSADPPGAPCRRLPRTSACMDGWMDGWTCTRRTSPGHRTPGLGSDRDRREPALRGAVAVAGARGPRMSRARRWQLSSWQRSRTDPRCGSAGAACVACDLARDRLVRTRRLRRHFRVGLAPPAGAAATRNGG